MSYDQNSAEAEAGRIGEEVADRYFRSLGYGVIRVADINGGPAMLERDFDPLILPDRQIVIPKVGMKYVEIKLKGAPIPFNQTGTNRHGIDLPKWHHYIRLMEEAMVQVGLAIVQVKDHRASTVISPRLLFQTIEILALNVGNIEPRPVSTFLNGAIFWEVDVFQDLGLIGDLFGRKEIPRTRLNLNPWERPAMNGSLPRPRNQGQAKLKL